MKFDDGTLVKSIDLPLTSAPNSNALLHYRGWHWSPDSKAIVYVNTVGDQLMAVRRNRSPASKLIAYLPSLFTRWAEAGPSARNDE